MAKRIAPIVLLLASLGTFAPSLAHSDEAIRNWWRDNHSDANWGKPCQVKVESKQGTYKREVRCKDGKGASWAGVWKEEFQDGECKVKLEATRDLFKEEVKCPPR